MSLYCGEQLARLAADERTETHLHLTASSPDVPLRNRSPGVINELARKGDYQRVDPWRL
jgi:hypothetical protein